MGFDTIIRNANGYKIKQTLKPENAKGYTEEIEYLSDSKVCIHKKIKRIGLDVYKKLHNMNIPGVPKVYEVKEDDVWDQTDVFEEKIDGISLQKLKDSGRNFSDKEVEDYLLQLCGILKALHRENIIHRDIKPDNILLDKYDRIWLIDYDVANIYYPEKIRDTYFEGTPGFAAPEQFGVAPSFPATDIWGLGKTAYDLLADNYNGYLSNVLAECTDKDWDRRYQSAEALAEAIKNAKIEYEVNLLREKEERQYQARKKAAEDIFIPRKAGIPRSYAIGLSMPRGFSVGALGDALNIAVDGIAWNSRVIKYNELKDIICPGWWKKDGFSFDSVKNIKIKFYSGEKDIEFITFNQEVKRRLWFLAGPGLMKNMLTKHIEIEKRKVLAEFYEYDDDLEFEDNDPDFISVRNLTLGFNSVQLCNTTDHKLGTPTGYISFKELRDNFYYKDGYLRVKDSSAKYRDYDNIHLLYDADSFKSWCVLLIVKTIVEHKVRNLCDLLDYTFDICASDYMRN